MFRRAAANANGGPTIFVRQQHIDKLGDLTFRGESRRLVTMRQLFGALAHPRALSCFTRMSSHRAAPLLGCVAVALAVTACKPETPSAHVRPEAQTKVATKSVPKPHSNLMAREAPPQCLYAEAASEAASPEPARDAEIHPAVATTATATNEEAQRRERERDCFRDAEMPRCRDARARQIDQVASLRSHDAAGNRSERAGIAALNRADKIAPRRIIRLAAAGC